MDHGIREEPTTHLLGFLPRDLRILGGQVDQEKLRAVDPSDPLEPEERQGLLDVVALRVRDAFPQVDLDADAHHGA